MGFDFASIEGLSFVQGLRFSRWTYGIVNAAHILGIALTVGAALPLAARLIWVWRDVSLAHMARVLATSSAVGLVIAVSTGLLLFATRATEYADNPAFIIKIMFILVALISASHAHWRYGLTLETASTATLARIGGLSILCWVGAVTSGRMIAFVVS